MKNLQLDVIRFKNEDVITTSCALKGTGTSVSFVYKARGNGDIRLTEPEAIDKLFIFPEGTYHVDTASVNKWFLKANNDYVSWDDDAKAGDSFSGVFHINSEGNYVFCVDGCNDEVE